MNFMTRPKNCASGFVYKHILPSVRILPTYHHDLHFIIGIFWNDKKRNYYFVHDRTLSSN